MDRARIGNLTPGMRACLTLVLEHKSSKQIAIELGLSHHTVDDRIKEAMRILGVGSRIDAAKWAALHLDDTPQRLGHQPTDLAETAAAASHGIDQTGARSQELPEPQEGVSGMTTSLDAKAAWPVPTRGRPYNDLGFWQRVGWIMAIAAGSILLLYLLVLTFDALVASLIMLSARLG